jgi:hypothetical protein
MNRSVRVRLILFALLIVCLAFTTLFSAPKPVEAACTYTGCGNWLYNGCCGSHLYQYRQCCNSTGSCCFQYRCTTAPCMF